MKNNYLATIVFDPKGSDGSTDEMIPKLSEIIVSVDGEVQKVESQVPTISLTHKKEKQPLSLFTVRAFGRSRNADSA